MGLPTWKCVTCDKTFKVGEWLCQDGQSNHVVANKRYLLADAPSDPGHPERGGMDSRKNGSTIICNIPPDKQVVVNGELSRVPGGSVTFHRGVYETSDPETQYYLDKKGGYCSEQQWEAAWLSQSQQLEIKEMSLRAREQRLENDRNDLLSQVQKQKQPVAAH